MLKFRLSCLGLIFMFSCFIFLGFKFWGPGALAQELELPADLIVPATGGFPEQPTLEEKEEVSLVEDFSLEPAEETRPGVEPEIEPVGGNVTLDFKEADIRNVLRILSYKSGINIVASPEVSGLVTIRLMDVPWQTALDVILRTYGFGYEKVDNIIAVSPLEKLTAQKKAESELAEVQPTQTRVFNLKYIDAGDAKKAIEDQLSSRGKITILEMTGPAGWEFGTSEFGKRKRLSGETRARSKTLIISDVPPALEKIVKIIEELDVMPQQVLIEARIMEVQRDALTDFGLDYGTGSSGASSTAVTGVEFEGETGLGGPISTIGGHLLGTQVTPSGYAPASGTGLTVFNTGLELVFKKLSGTQFEIILHALEEDSRTNTLSAPRIVTLNNQEASILVGTKYPILESETSEYGQVTTTLGYYQDIGVQLNVVPQINDRGYINMIVHPAVTTQGTTVGTNAYPIINSRETEAQILIKSGETVVIGGLLRDVKTKTEFSIPILGKIPFIGWLFKRTMEDTLKQDLLIFITARILESEEALAKLEEAITTPEEAEPAKE